MKGSSTLRVVVAIVLAAVVATVLYRVVVSGRGASGGGGTADEKLERARTLASVHYVNSRLDEPRYRDEVFKAVDAARDCVAMAPGSAVDRLNLAIALLRLYDEKRSAPHVDAPKALNEAIDLLEQVRRDRPDLALAHFHAAMAQVRRGNLQASDPASDWKAKLSEDGAAYLRIEDRSAALRYHLGKLAFDADDYATAEPALRRAIELDPDHPNAYYTLGLILARQGKKEESDRVLERHKVLAATVGAQRKQWDPDAVFDTAFPELLAAGTPTTPAGAAARATMEPLEAPGNARTVLALLRGDPAITPELAKGTPQEGKAARPVVLAWTESGESGFWTLRNGKAARADDAAAPKGARVRAAAPADLDADHFLDAVLATDAGLAAIRARGPLAADGFEPLPMPGVPDDLGAVDDVLAADLDADADLDLVVAAGGRV
ncbi:MAG TPA: tetratricopeptide repeat protein, partial [Planctomycetota bacterium]|nr:tetratricopeptide repeat protein [Planctomycetota bacterium]